MESPASREGGHYSERVPRVYLSQEPVARRSAGGYPRPSSGYYPNLRVQEVWGTPGNGTGTFLQHVMCASLCSVSSSLQQGECKHSKVEEDFAILPMIMKNFIHNPHAETIFGRNEPALTYRHKMFEDMYKEGLEQVYHQIPSRL